MISMVPIIVFINCNIIYNVIARAYDILLHPTSAVSSVVKTSQFTMCKTYKNSAVSETMTYN